jgi:hypothetical protein
VRLISVSEIGLAVILMSRSFTRIYQRRAVELYGIAGVRAAQTPGSGVIPTWVSLLTVIGWGATLLAVAGLIAE